MIRSFILVLVLLTAIYACQDHSGQTNLQKVTDYIEDSTLCATYFIDDSSRIQGVFTVKDLNGHIVAEKTYEDDILNGPERNYYPNGQLEGEYAMKDGLYEGPYKTYSEEGILLSEGHYKENMIEGELRTYYDNGKLKEIVNMQQNMTSGPFKEFDESGFLAAEGSYVFDEEKDALEDGLLLLYEDEKLIRKMVCDTGLCCTLWTAEKGDVEPVNELCRDIIQKRMNNE